MADVRVVTLEIRSASAGRVLAERTIRWRSVRKPDTWQELTLPFAAPAGHALETRVHWHGHVPEGIEAGVHELVKILDGKGESSCTVYDGREVVKMMLGILQSQQEGNNRAGR